MPLLLVFGFLSAAALVFLWRGWPPGGRDDSHSALRVPVPISAESRPSLSAEAPRTFAAWHASALRVRIMVVDAELPVLESVTSLDVALPEADSRARVTLAAHPALFDLPPGPEWHVEQLA